MAFFNLTQLGVQDPIKAAVKSSAVTSPPSNAVTSSPSSATPTLSATKGNDPKYTFEAQGSYVKYTERLTKHQRTKNDPNEIYSKPITSSQDYGWWRQDGAPKSLPWTEIQKYSRVNSEMTRFVDEMTLTNKDFTLF